MVWARTKGPPVEQIDSRAGFPFQIGGQPLNQHDGRAQIYVHVPLPNVGCRLGRPHRLENGGIVNQQLDRPQGVRGTREQARGLLQVGQVSSQGGGLLAGLPDEPSRLLGWALRSVKVDDDVRSGLGQGYGEFTT